MPVYLQVVGLGVALWAPLLVMMSWMSSNFAEIRSDIAELRLDMQAMDSRLETRLTAQIQELDTRLTARIQELDSRLTAQIQELDSRLSGQILALDNKITAIGDMTVIAFTDGEISSAELAAIWDRASAE